MVRTSKAIISFHDNSFFNCRRHSITERARGLLGVRNSEILPLPANLCFEGTGISPDVQSLLVSNPATEILPIPAGTIWPKPSVFHVRATETFLDQLAALAEHHAEPEMCDHFHAYNGLQGLMQWYDAFSGDPLLVDGSIAEAKVQTFCRELGVPYARWRWQDSQTRTSPD